MPSRHWGSFGVHEIELPDFKYRRSAIWVQNRWLVYACPCRLCFAADSRRCFEPAGEIGVDGGYAGRQSDRTDGCAGGPRSAHTLSLYELRDTALSHA